MKIETLRRKNIINLVVAIVFLGIFIFSIFFNSSRNQDLKMEAEEIKNSILQITAQTHNLQSKTIEFKKYRETWPTISENKKNTIGIKMDDVNAKLAVATEKHVIFNPSIKVSLPENLEGGLFERSTVSVLFSKINLTFEAVDDVRAMSFLSEFLASLPGYPVLNEVNMSKSKDYTSQDLVNISMGKGSGAIKCNATISWYALKAKEVKAQEG